MKKSKKILLFFILFCFIVLVVLATLVYYGILHLNNPSKEKYGVRGVDVSSYQGEIDWNVLSQQDIKFAFIKATEGSSLVDSKFQYNWENANNTDMFVGAYHFFSFESSGKTQAQNFISAVGELKENSLPPVIDIEYYNDEVTKSVTKEQILYEINLMIQELKEYYNCSPILYVTEKTYNDFVKGNISGCKLWVRSVYEKPCYIDESEWTFWQYSNRHRLDGYKGTERYIDMNVFNGTLNEFYNTFS